MPNRTDARERITTFLTLTFLLSAIFWVLIWQAAGIRGSGGVFVIFLMWCPGVAALITTFAFQHNVRGLGWRPGNWRYSLLAFALPIAYAAVVYGLAWLTGLGAFSTQIVPPGQSILLTLMIAGPVVFLLGGVGKSLGEEIGWRGMLVPQLARLTSFTNVALITGAIWALWHVPILLFAGYNSGTPVWYALICFLALEMGGSFACAWLRLKSGSLWPSTILHASHNFFVQSIFDAFTVDTGITPYITTEFGIGLALVGGVMVLLFWRLASNDPKTNSIPATLQATV